MGPPSVAGWGRGSGPCPGSPPGHSGPQGLTAQQSVWTRPALLEEVVQRGVAAGPDVEDIVALQGHIEAWAIQLGPDGWSWGNHLPEPEPTGEIVGRGPASRA